MNLSYWEYKTWLSDIDFTIVGSGIVGLNCALRLKQHYPKAKVLILEKGILPQGASTKNAGFACFGSISEILSDLRTHTEEEVVNLVQKRWHGVQLLRSNLGDKTIGFQQHGGHELFLENYGQLYAQCLDKLPYINSLLEAVYKGEAFRIHANIFGFKNIQGQYVTNDFEGQLNTGKMMMSLLRKVQQSGVILLNVVEVKEFVEMSETVSISTDKFDFRTKKLLIATNGFASQLLNEKVRPARAQVLITRPIQHLRIKGAFHFNEGYYYFRNIDNRILFGGGRNLDFKGEQTFEFGQTEVIQNTLEETLKTIILPKTDFIIEQKWSGIMGVGDQKRPIVKQLSDNVFCGVRLGGMGIAIGSSVGNELADLV